MSSESQKELGAESEVETGSTVQNDNYTFFSFFAIIHFMGGISFLVVSGASNGLFDAALMQLMQTSSIVGLISATCLAVPLLFIDKCKKSVLNVFLAVTTAVVSIAIAFVFYLQPFILAIDQIPLTSN